MLQSLVEGKVVRQSKISLVLKLLISKLLFLITIRRLAGLHGFSSK